MSSRSTLRSLLCAKPAPIGFLLTVLLALGIPGIVPVPAKGASPAAPAASQVDPAALQRWRDARFGMFIHWGPVSQTGYEISWSRGTHTPIDKYDNLYKTFDPEKFNADEWVSIAKAAGMKYIVLTCKHHDGFCLWPTKQTDYNIANTPFKRDIVGELAAACKKQGLPFGCYYSTTDWYNPDFPLTSPDGTVSRPTSNLDKYTDYLKAQVRELLTNYGPLFTLWFDYPQKFNAERGQGVIDMARSIQPSIVINNRTGAPGDYDTPEQQIGAFNRQRPWESCMTIARQWAWRPGDPIKSMKECLQALITSSGGDGNFIFNVGPRPDGQIDPPQVARLKEMGDWLSKYGESIYGTRGGPYEPNKGWVSTCRGNDIYLHILNWTGDSLKLPPLGRKIIKGELLTGGKADVKQDADGVTVAVAPSDRQDIDTLVKLELDGPATELAPIATPSGSLALGRPATASSVYQNDPQYVPAKAFDDNPATRWAAADGTGPAWLEIDLGQPTTIASVHIVEGESPGHRGLYQIVRFELQYFDQGQWKTFHTRKGIGRNLQLSFKPFQAQRIRLYILSAKRAPSIAEFQIFSIP